MIAWLLTGALAAAWLTARHAPEAPFARLLRAWLVDWPARKLLHVERRHLIFLLVAVVSAQALLSVGLPDLGVVIAWDVSTYVDLLLVTWTLAAVTNLKAAGRMTAARWRLLTTSRRGKPQPRSRRPARRATPSPSINDDDRPAVALAA
jgi:hypothetical protein